MTDKFSNAAGQIIFEPGEKSYVTVQTPGEKRRKRVDSKREAAEFGATCLDCDVEDVYKAFKADASDVEEAPQKIASAAAVVQPSVKAASFSPFDSLESIARQTADLMPGTPSVDIGTVDGHDVAEIDVDLGILEINVQLRYDTRTKAKGVSDDVLHVDAHIVLDPPFVSAITVLDSVETLPAGEWIEKIDVFDWLS